MTDSSAPTVSNNNSHSTLTGTLLKDPALGAYVFFAKHLPLDSTRDSRLDLIGLLERAREQLRLNPAGAARYSEPAGIDLYAVHSSPPEKDPLINLLRQDNSEVHQALAFTFLDSLTAQLMFSRTGLYTLDETKQDLNHFVADVVTPELLANRDEDTWGGQLFLWSILPADLPFDETSRQVFTDLGAHQDRMLRCPLGTFSQITINGCDALVLLTPDTLEAEKWANRILFEHTPALPPAMLLLALAGCKFDWEFEQYAAVKPTLDHLSSQIDRRLSWMIDAQRAYEHRLRVVGSRESSELLEKLSRATTDYADFRRAVTRVNELRTTLQINAENYRSRLNAIAGTTQDTLFSPRLQKMDRIQAQLTYESAYFAAVLDRGQTILDAASARLEILRGEQEREQITFQGIQTSAITAIMAGLAALQVLPILSALGSQWLIGLLIVTLMALTFALSQIVINWKRVNTAADRIGVAIATGLIFSLPLVAGWELRPTGIQLLSTLVLFLIGLALGYGLFIFFEERNRRMEERKRARELLEVQDPIGKLLTRARDELRELLDDLPPTEVYRVKGRDSLTEKLERKGYQHLTEVGDEIGVRYVVAPWEIPRTVKRIQSLLRLREIEYKQGEYKAVHMLADLLGPGDDRDLDLTAEIQVKTHWQNRFAIFAHDRLYKTGGAKPGVFAKSYGWGLARLTDLELLLFRRSMGWPEVAQSEQHHEVEQRLQPRVSDKTDPK